MRSNVAVVATGAFRCARSPEMAPVEARREVHGEPLGEAARVRLGAHPDTAPDILQALASDVSVTVRASLALNSATPIATNATLAGDMDERVRALVARKLALLVPALSVSAQTR